jgi:2-keto-4-pentenoate hydratase
MSAVTTARDASRDPRADAFVEARLKMGTIPDYPGEAPQSLHDAYAIQDRAIAAWPDELAGWKVGRIPGALVEQYGTDRLAGPVFRKQVVRANGEVPEMPVFADGFAAIEGEVLAVLAADAPHGVTEFSTEDALSLIGALHVGVEIASSPFPGINDHGPLVTISDFGNNHGLIVGDEIPDWRRMRLEDWSFRTEINGSEVGVNSPAGLPGGPVESVRFLLENAAQRGLQVTAGMMILTGAVTGVHQAHAGDEARITFQGAHDIRCRLVAG